jgi:flap endonuclease-1
VGVSIGDIIQEGKESIELEHLDGRTIAIDAYNMLYQFLSIIRQPDGTPLMNSRGEVTSHLTGLMYRTAKLLENGIKPCFVFDGMPPEKKQATIEERVKVRMEAREKWEKALAEGREEEAKTYAMQSSKLTSEMVDQSKELLNHLGIPWVQAPSEGEAQASFMLQKEAVWAVASQDYDSLLFGAQKLVRNLSATGKRKLPRKKVYIVVKPEVIILDSVLTSLKITREQLVDLALIVGTDYNEGIKGLGAKKALALVQDKKTAEEVFEEHGASTQDLDLIRGLFLKPEATSDFSLEWKKPDDSAVMDFLCKRYEFSQERVKNTLSKIKERFDTKATQSRLDQWTGGG